MDKGKVKKAKIRSPHLPPAEVLFDHLNRINITKKKSDKMALKAISSIDGIEVDTKSIEKSLVNDNKKPPSARGEFASTPLKLQKSLGFGITRSPVRESEAI